LTASYQSYKVFTTSIDVKEIETIEKNTQLIPDLPLDFNNDNYLGLTDAISGLSKITEHNMSNSLLDDHITLPDIIKNLGG